MQHGKHGPEVTALGSELRCETLRDVAQLLREIDLVFQLGARAQRDADELRRFPAAIAAGAFGKVAGNRGRCPAHLMYQTILFFDRIDLSRPIDGQRQFVSPLP
jgi:hypothetical protein